MTNSAPDSFDLAGIGTFVSDSTMWDGYYLGPEFEIPVLGQPIAVALGAGRPEGRAAELAREAIENFRAAGPTLREQVAKYLFDYYTWVRIQFSEEECVDYDIPLDVTLDNVWEHVNFLHPASVEPSLDDFKGCLLYTSPSPRDGLLSRMPSSA